MRKTHDNGGTTAADRAPGKQAGSERQESKGDEDEPNPEPDFMRFSQEPEGPEPAGPLFFSPGFWTRNRGTGVRGAVAKVGKARA